MIKDKQSLSKDPRMDPTPSEVVVLCLFVAPPPPGLWAYSVTDPQV